MNNHIVVIKCGGSTLDQLPATFYEELVELQKEGVAPVIVHGGGPAISGMLKTMGIEPHFIDGMRVTDAATLEVVKMVLIGQTNKQVVVRLQQAGGKAAGISGIDANILQVEPLEGDLGYVGRIIAVGTEFLQMMMQSGYIPVISPLGSDQSGQVFNINADTAAGAIAGALRASSMVMVTDVSGVLKENDNGEKQVIPSLTTKQVLELIDNGTIYGGMIPKVRAALDCLAQCGTEVAIINGNQSGMLTRAVKTGDAGTRIISEEAE